MDSPNNTLLSPEQLKKQADKDRPALDKWITDHAKLLHLLLDAYCIVDITGNVIHFNDAFQQLCGISYRKIIKKGNFLSLIDFKKGLGEKLFKGLMKPDATLRFDEVAASSIEHEKLNLIVSGVSITGTESSQVWGAVILIRDVTAESQLQEKYTIRKEESVTDGLTGMYNKKFIEETLLRSVQSSMRELKSLSVIMCDIDHFKRVNDDFGHLAGDYVLGSVAEVIREEVRGTDVVGRYGGEEFIVILAGNNVAGAKIFAERLRKSIEKLDLSFDGHQIPLTMSLGTFTFSTKWTPGVDSEALSKETISKADEALYHAKESGRNRVVQYEAMPSKKEKKAS